VATSVQHHGKEMSYNNYLVRGWGWGLAAGGWWLVALVALVMALVALALAQLQCGAVTCRTPLPRRAGLLCAPCSLGSGPPG
jgi:hypothetical protein